MAHFDPSSREEEAQEEMAATRISRALAAALAGLFLVLLASGPVLEAGAARSGRSEILAALPAASGSLLARVRAAIAELESRFDDRSALVRAVRPPAQELLLAALRYGNERAYVGRHGWLFFRPDFDHLTGSARSRAGSGEPVAAALAFRDELARRGIALVVLPAPAKLAVQPGQFVAGAPAPPLRPPAEAGWLAALERAGVEVVDPAERLAARARAGRPAYLERDTHWRPEAMDEVARALAIVLRGAVELSPGEPERFRERTLPVAGGGDIAALLGLPAGETATARQQVEIRPVEDARSGGRSWRPERGAPVLLLGDSFAAVFSQPELGWGAGAGLAERLSFHLGLPVDRITRNAGGASSTRAALAEELARDPARLAGVKAIVWELAARELTQGEWRAVALPDAPAAPAAAIERVP